MAKSARTAMSLKRGTCVAAADLTMHSKIEDAAEARPRQTIQIELDMPTVEWTE